MDYHNIDVQNYKCLHVPNATKITVLKSLSCFPPFFWTNISIKEFYHETTEQDNNKDSIYHLQKVQSHQKHESSNMHKVVPWFNKPMELFWIRVYCTVIRKAVLETDGSRIYDLRSQYVSKCMGNMVHDILIITDTLCSK